MYGCGASGMLSGATSIPLRASSGVYWKLARHGVFMARDLFDRA